MDVLNLLLDPYFIRLYRVMGYPFADFMLGTFALAFLAVMVGEFCIGTAFLINRRFLDSTSNDAVRYQKVSMDALVSGDKTAYAASNKIANEAFGKTFFAQIAMSGGFLWPAFVAGGWMQYRFSEVEFRLLFTDYTVGALCPFVALYVAAYLVFKRIKYRLPYFRRIKPILDSYHLESRKSQGFRQLEEAKSGPISTV